MQHNVTMFHVLTSRLSPIQHLNCSLAGHVNAPKAVSCRTEVSIRRLGRSNEECRLYYRAWRDTQTSDWHYLCEN